MATAAGDSTAYSGGAGGKFRRRPFRRPPTTPYDRPPTALRNTRRNDDNSSSRGWLSRIVDPASKLITASAHKLFSSVFRKRLLPPPPQPSRDEEVEPLENHLGDAMTEAPRIQESDMIEGNTHSGSMTDGVAELMDVLKQKTFTRSEIDRLMVLLHSRKVDNTATEGQRRVELTPSEPSASHSRQKDLRGTAFENGFNLSGVSRNDLTPTVRSNVNVDDVAAPNELAKAYISSMSTRVSPSTLGPHSRAVREETPGFATHNLHRPSVSTVQTPSSPARTSHNEFVVPRSRGRSAIYSMARTPYSRVQPTATKVLGMSNDALDGQSLLSSQKALKRRSSVLENDIGTAGPIRRIRQKPNLLYPKTFTNATPSGIGEASSSKSHEDKVEKGPISSSHVSSKSIEMGQRILQQLEKLTPPRESSNEKKPGFSGGMSGMELTPSMLSGQARKSLETVDSLKYVQSDELSRKIVDSWDSVGKAQDSTPKGQGKFYDSSSNVMVNSSSKTYSENDKARITDNDVMAITKNTTPVVLKSAVDAPKRSPGFQMSAYESLIAAIASEKWSKEQWQLLDQDYLDLDDDAHLNGVASPSVNEGKNNSSVSSPMMSNGKLPDHPSLAETTKADRTTLPDATKADRTTFPAVESFSNSALKNASTVDASNTAENGISHNLTDSILNKANGSSIASLQSDKTSVSAKADIPASTIGFGLKSSDKVSSPSFITASVVESSITKNVTSSVFSFGGASTDAAFKSPGSNKESTESVDLVKKSDNASSSEPGSSFSTISSFGSFPLKSAAAPSPLLFSSQSSSSGISAQSTFTTSNTGTSATRVGADAVDIATGTASSNTVATSVAFPSFQSTFKGSSLASDSSNLTDLAGTSKETALGNSTSSNLVGAASVPAQASAISGFQFGVMPTSGTSSTQLQASASTSVSTSSIFGDQILPSTTEHVHNQPTASALPVSSVSSSLPMNSGSLASASAPVTSSSAFRLSSPNIFGGSPQPTNSPVFGSALNNSSSSSGLGSFGVSAAPTPSSSASSSGFAFGTSSMSAPANDSSAVAPFGSSSTSTASPSLTFGSSAPPSGSVLSSGFNFGTSSISAPANGSLGAASSISATSSSTPSVFGFGVSSSASSSAPSSSFSFGPSPTSANTGATSSTFSFGASSASASASSSAPSSSFAFGASPVSANSSAPPSTFSFGASSASASSSAPSSSFAFGASPVSANSSAPPSTFSFGASSSGAPSSTFSFGASSASAPSTTPSSPFLFGSSSASATPTTTPAFPFGSAAASTPAQPSQPAFGNSSSIFGFGSTPSPSPLGNNDQMSMEDSMVEDSSSMHQSPTLTPTPVFGQTLPTSNFSFGMAQAQVPSPSPAPASLGASPFQFGGQQNLVAATPNPFQTSGSFDGGSFSLGAGGNDKSNRRIVKVKGRNRKK